MASSRSRSGSRDRGARFVAAAAGDGGGGGGGGTPEDLTGAVMSASSQYGSAAASRAQDGNTGTEWMANNVIPCWLKASYAFATPVGSYKITAMSSQGSRAPGTWTLQGSNDDTTWTTVDSQGPVSNWANGEVRTYTLSATATYSKYRLNISAKTTAGDGYINLGEFWLRTPGGAQTPTPPTDITPAGTLTASSTFSTSVASNTQDGSGTTEWQSNGIVASWLKVVYGATKTVRAYRLQASGSFPNRAPYSWTFEGSNDGSSWTVLDTQTTVPTWLSGEPRIYGLASPASYTQFRINVSAKMPAGDNYINLAEFWPQQ